MSINGRLRLNFFTHKDARTFAGMPWYVSVHIDGELSMSFAYFGHIIGIFVFRKIWM